MSAVSTDDVVLESIFTLIELIVDVSIEEELKNPFVLPLKIQHMFVELLEQHKEISYESRINIWKKLLGIPIRV